MQKIENDRYSYPRLMVLKSEETINCSFSKPLRSPNKAIPELFFERTFRVIDTEKQF